MKNDELWTSSDEIKFEKSSTGISAIRISLLFATAAIALAVVVTPMLTNPSSENIAYSEEGPYDNLMTSSVNRGPARTTGSKDQPFPGIGNSSAEKNSYTIRRSIIQTSKAPCIIYGNGSKSESCH